MVTQRFEACLLDEIPAQMSISFNRGPALRNGGDEELELEVEVGKAHISGVTR